MLSNKITKLIAGTAVMATVAVFTMSTPVLAKTNDNVHLKFNSNGKYKIVQFTDIQDNQNTNTKTLKLMGTVLDKEKPDLVVITGDNLDGGCKTADDVKTAINNFAQIMEQRNVKWAVTYGNHDMDHTWRTGLDEEDMLKIYMSYDNNLNKPSERGITGTGNMYLTIRDSQNKKDTFNVWLLDSGRYAPGEINGQSMKGYDWMRFDQVNWYYQTSQKLEKQAGNKVPSLMFMHIPLWEYRFMWYGSVDSRTDADHVAAVEKYRITGERNEVECPGTINSGMFSALLDRGDVKGVFVGHDHVNDYVGNYYGIHLGYSANTGFATYGLGGDENDRMRGARVFNLNQNNAGNFETHMVYAKDFGIK